MWRFESESKDDGLRLS